MALSTYGCPTCKRVTHVHFTGRGMEKWSPPICERCRSELVAKHIDLPVARVLAPWWRRLLARVLRRRARPVKMLPEFCAPPASLRTNLHNSAMYASATEVGTALQKLNRAMDEPPTRQLTTPLRFDDINELLAKIKEQARAQPLKATEVLGDA